MVPAEFIKAYEAALATQDWTLVAPLVSENVHVTFSDGSVHAGKDKVQIAFEHNFSKIKSEKYSIENVQWIKQEESYAVYLFEFYWSGLIEGKLVSGSGVGTSVIIKENDEWKLLNEHLGRKSTPA